jgi:tape measure domain-containing protein
MASLGDIVIGLSMDNSQFQRTAQNSRGTLSQLGQSAMGTVGQIAGMLGVGSALAAVGFGVKLAADAEQTQIAFEVMLGSAGRAKSMLAELKQVSDKSPFSTEDVQQFAKTLVNYGVEGKKVVPTIKMLGDVAAGDKEKFEGLSRAYGQISSTGRLMGQDLNQLINAGFNPLQEISKKTGESMGALKKRMEDGNVSFSEVESAFQSATSEGGRFFGMTERQSQTLSGKFSTLKDSVNESLKTIGQQIITSLDLSSALDHLTAFATEAPMIFRNAGSLIEVATIDWQISLFEFLPASESIFEKIGVYINATWEASTASFKHFTANLFASLQEIKNMALATWASIKEGNAAIAQGRDPITAASDAFQKTIASQQTPEGAKTNFATEFQKAFDASVKNAEEGFKDQGGLAASLKARKEKVLQSIVEKESQLKPLAEQQAEADNAPELGGNKDTAGKKKKEEKSKPVKSESKAAFLGSSEAAQQLLSGVFGTNKDVFTVAKQQLAEQKATTNAIKAKNSTGPKFLVVNV